MPSKSLINLNNGWPFTDGPGSPMARPFRFELRTDTLETADGPLTSRRLFAVCASCPQAVMALSEPLDVAADVAAPESYTIDLTTLKARIADHWLKCHEDEIASETYW